MDVTFTNVLEGARQYFQGLPAATGSAASPASSTLSYGGGVGGVSGGSAATYTTSAPVSTADALPVAATAAAAEPAHFWPAPDPQYQYAPQNATTYQFPRPQETPSVLHYSSHYSPTTHRPLNVSRPHEQMPAASPKMPPAQSYHQLQTPRHHHTPSPNGQNNVYYQSKNYYPTANSANNSASSQSYQFAYSPQQTPVQVMQQQQQTPIPTPEPAANHLPASHRTTHNLPPIAALSSVNYHSNKSSREAVQRLTNHRHHRASSVAATTTLTVPSSTMSTTTRIPQQYGSKQNSGYPSSGSGSYPTGYQYPPTPAQGFTCTTTSSNNSSSSSSTSSTVSAFSPSSYSQHLQKINKTAYQETPQQYQTSKEYPFQATSNPSARIVENVPSSQQSARSDTHLQQQQMPTATTTTTTVSAMTVMSSKQKRESPLDLSVKTVRTSADSTALDEPDILVHNADSQQRLTTKNYGSTSNRSMPPPMQVPPAAVSYGSYDHNLNNHQRNASIRTNTPAVSSGAPKVDFLPNFNVQSLHHHNSQRTHSAENNRQIIQQTPPSQQQQQHMQQPQQHTDKTNQQYSRNMSAYSNKVYYHQQQTSYHPSASYPHNYNSSTNNMIQNAAYNTAQVPPKRPTDQSLPRIEFPPQGQNSANKMYHPGNPQQRNSNKRPADNNTSGVPTKIQKSDVWRQTIDQQIEQRLSSYANSRKQMEQQMQSHSGQPVHHQQQQQNVQQQHANSLKNNSMPKQQIVNGNMMPSNHHRSREMYMNYSQNHPAYPQAKQPFTASNNTNQYHAQTPSHTQTYVPTMGQHHYPNISPHQQQDLYQQNMLPRSNSNPKLSQTSTSPIRNNNFGGADKRVLSILRNSLEIKGAKEAQKKLEQVQQKPHEIHPVNMNHMRVASGVQQPTTDVTAPLQPKHGIISRHNVSPFPASNLLERTTNTPPSFKFQFPRAVDSVSFESDNQMHKEQQYTMEEAPQNIIVPPVNTSSDLDGLAAFLAARIRTKAELKQVGTNQIQNISTSSENAATNISNINTSIVNMNSTGAVPSIKVCNKDKTQPGVLPSRRRLFSRSEDELSATATAPSSSNSGIIIPRGPIRNSVVRSSSETSVFDFRDSDSEGEMRVLERQSLDDMRRDRKILNKTTPFVVASENEEMLDCTIKQEKIDDEDMSSTDPFWSDTCDKFLEQLKTSGGKKRGRRKKIVEPDVLTKLETITKERPLENINLDVVVKLENIDLLSQTKDSSPQPIKTELPENQPPKLIPNDDSDSDVPLARRKNTPVKQEDPVSDGEDSLIEPKKDKIEAKIKIEYTSDESSDSDTETIQSVSEKLRNRKLKDINKQLETDKGMVLRSADSSPSKRVAPTLKKKAIFGDGSDFHPGWEEEVYRYKRSLRMPARLINITRAPHWHRMSTSLPDLDPCSPAPSSLTDDTEFSIHRRSLPPNNFNDSISSLASNKIKRDILDSDIDSNSSFTFSYQKGSYDSEEASCSSLKSSTTKEKSLKNKENNNSILDVLVERYSKHKRKKSKVKDPKAGPKIIPKSSNSLELLPTPSLGIGTPDKPRTGKTTKLDINSSVYLGFFRKETVNNFRDTFKKNSAFMDMSEPFSTVVLKSRTRTETRVMKQRATIREVFGEERPASAPPIACRDDSSQDCVAEKKTKLKPKENTMTPIRAGLRSASGRRTNKTILLTKKIRGRKRTNTLLKVLTSKQMSDLPLDTIKSSPPSVKSLEGEINNIIPTKKRLKLRNMRRKFSSGFDYIRKKKKQVKAIDGDGSVKVKRRGIIPRPSPESVQDIQREIKTWVMNKGVGETHLHRAARLGYTDVTAYCLEKLDCTPSPKDNAGYTPLHEASSRGHLDISRLLLQYGANVSESAQGGIRPLHEAAENGYVEIIRLLLSYGADPMLATYSGLTPLSLATDEETRSLLKHYMADMQGLAAPPWSFRGPASCFDPDESGYDPLSGPPLADPIPVDEDLEIEMSDQQLPNLYVLRGEPANDRWVLLQDLSLILKIKSRDTLLRQLTGNGAASTSSAANRSLLKELKFSDFLEQAHCCQLLCANEKLNVRSTKIALVKYTDKVKQLLGAERVVVTTR